MFEYLALVVTLMTLNLNVRSIMHTSRIELKEIYELQMEQFNVFNNYLDLEMIRLAELKKTLAVLHQWRGEKFTTNKTYLPSHINAIKMMSQLYDRLLKIEHLINNKQSIEKLNAIYENIDSSWKNLYLAIRTVRTLQRFYSIPVSDMAAGRFNERIIGDPLDACECFLVLKVLFKIQDMYGVNNWAFEAYKKWDDGGQPKCVNIEELTNYMILSSLYTGFNFRSFFISNEINYSKSSEKFVKHSFLMQNEYNKTDERRTMYSIRPKFRNLNANKWFLKFRHLCKHGRSLWPLTKNMQCRYQTKNVYYRILMPFKEEDISSDPYLKIYHDVLFDGEISKLKSLAIEFATRSLDKSISTKDTHIARLHSGQYSWIDDEYAEKHLSSLNTRIECFTGFSMESAQSYRIINYGLSGPNFIPHYDAHRNQTLGDMVGNRLLTVLFYLSDVKDDGYTAFPYLGFNTPVEKGSALVFRNLHKTNGSLHDLTFHGSCPILKGDKWVMTKWLHESGQYLPYDWRENKLYKTKSNQTRTNDDLIII